MRRMVNSYTLAEETVDFIGILAEELKISRSKAVEFIVKVASEQLGIAGLILHHGNGYKAVDYRGNDTILPDKFPNPMT